MFRLGLIATLTGLVLGALGGCGGGDASITGGGTPPPSGNNVAPVIVDAGPTVNGQPLGTANVLFVNVTICTPGSTTECQTIDHIQVDTGSTGLRLISSVLSSSVTLHPVNTGNSSSPLAECYVFADGYIWGPVRTADIQVAGETASNVEVQVIGDPTYATVPADCQSAGAQVGGQNEDTVTAFAANGILGVAPFVQDCGSFCTAGAPAAWYYACPSPSSCSAASVSLIEQVTNPVTLFAQDNNGVIIQLPSVADAGAPTVSGSLIFGLGTESNNNVSAGSVAQLLLDPSSGYFTTTYKGTVLTQSYIDSGSNAYFFNDASITPCSDNAFFCPASTLALSATNSSASGTGSGTSSVINFNVANADNLSAMATAFNNLGGPASMNAPTQSFDWGLSFFYGRSVYSAVEGMNTPAGVGPYFAY